MRGLFVLPMVVALGACAGNIGTGSTFPDPAYPSAGYPPPQECQPRKMHPSFPNPQDYCRYSSPSRTYQRYPNQMTRRNSPLSDMQRDSRSVRSIIGDVLSIQRDIQR